MKILILTTSHPFKAAGIVAYDILKGLANIEGNDVRILVKQWDKYKDNRILPIESSFEHQINITLRFFFRIKRKLLRTILKNYKTKEEKLKLTFDSDYIFDYKMSKTIYPTSKIFKRIGFVPDIVLTLFMSEFISFKNLYEINKITGAVIFIYPMDMAPFTGGCHYAWNCKKYQNKCCRCPALFSEKEEDLAYVNYINKKVYIEKTKIELLAGTENLYKQISKSSLFYNYRVNKVLLPIDNSLFKSINKIPLRKKIGLPEHKKIILFGALSLDEKRKGVKELIEALNYLHSNLNLENQNNIHLLIAGNQNENLTHLVPFPHTFAGCLNVFEMPTLYQVADLFVNSSIEEAGPMMINQSIFCGTPVVAFEIGVALDLVISGKTGYRASLKNSHDLARGMQSIIELSEKDYKKMAENCEKLSYQYHYKTQIEKINELFNNRLNEN